MVVIVIDMQGRI